MFSSSTYVFVSQGVMAHLCHSTTTFGLDPNIQYCYPDKGIVPTQILFCLKEKNQRKINSHRWAFRAFAPLLQVSAHSFLIQLLLI
jgi:cellulose synthase/poly-beta-1,6-N-acetylglucosamine synthase-like glycosyltransferase